MFSPYAPQVERYGRHWHRPWFVFLAFITFGASLWFVFPKKVVHREAWPLSIAEGDSREVIAAIRRAPRAIVFLDGRWSVNAALGRKNFKNAALPLAKMEIPSLKMFVLEEWPIGGPEEGMEDFVQKWFASLGLKTLVVGQGHGIGAGSLLWMEEGRVVHEEWSAMDMGVDGIVDRTRKVWQR